MSPWLVLLALLALITSQLLYAFAPYRRRSYLAILLLSAVGFAAGQWWSRRGWPAWKLGEAAILPGLVFALALQPGADLLARLRLPSSRFARPRREQEDDEGDAAARGFDA